MLAIWWTYLNVTCRNQNFGVCSDASMTIESRVMRTYYRFKVCFRNPCGIKSKSSAVFCFQEPEAYELSHIHYFHICHSPHVESKSQRHSLFGGLWKKCWNLVETTLSSTQAPLVSWQSGFVNLGKDCPSFPPHWPVTGERSPSGCRNQIMLIYSSSFKPEAFFNTVDQNIHLNYSSLN